jgi:hypothetical protein
LITTLASIMSDTMNAFAIGNIAVNVLVYITLNCLTIIGVDHYSSYGDCWIHFRSWFISHCFQLLFHQTHLPFTPSWSMLHNLIWFHFQRSLTRSLYLMKRIQNLLITILNGWDMDQWTSYSILELWSFISYSLPSLQFSF